MFSISEQVGHVVAADTRTSVSSLDAAVIAQARMCATVVEASGAEHLPIGTIQKVLDSLSSGIRDLVASRAELITAVRELNVIQSESSLQETSFGCPTGPYFATLREDPIGVAEIA